MHKDSREAWWTASRHLRFCKSTRYRDLEMLIKIKQTIPTTSPSKLLLLRWWLATWRKSWEMRTRKHCSRTSKRRRILLSSIKAQRSWAKKSTTTETNSRPCILAWKISFWKKLNAWTTKLMWANSSTKRRIRFLLVASTPRTALAIKEGCRRSRAQSLEEANMARELPPLWPQAPIRGSIWLTSRTPWTSRMQAQWPQRLQLEAHRHLPWPCKERTWFRINIHKMCKISKGRASLLSTKENRFRGRASTTGGDKLPPLTIEMTWNTLGLMTQRMSKKIQKIQRHPWLL